MQSYMLKVLRVGEPEPSLRIITPEGARKYWNAVIKKQIWFDEAKEHLIVLLLSTKFDVEGYSLVSIGCLNESIAHPREIFRAAVAAGCGGIVILHNHPSGDPSPSGKDHSLTCRLRDAADLLQINLLDHVIVGRRRNLKPADIKLSRGLRSPRRIRAAQETASSGYFSFKEAGVL
jgi:DNA repair protein RadC